MNKEFVPFKEAKALHELGFDEPCICGYSTTTEKLEIYSRFLITKDNFTIDAPLYQQAIRWLYKKLGIEKGIMPLDIPSQQLLLNNLIEKMSL